MSSHFFAYLSRMKLIKRWSLMRNTQNENLLEHSAQVAQIAHALAVIGNRLFGQNTDAGKVTLLALYHDVGEVIIGDLPTPVKHFNPQINQSYGSIEKIACEKLISLLPEKIQDDYRPLIFPENSREQRLVKAADKIAAHAKCLEEGMFGNRDFAIAEQATLRAVEKFYDLPEVVYFMENCMTSFSLAIDELD